MALYKIDTYGDNYSDTQLTNAAESSGEGASTNSPYAVSVTVSDNGLPILSTDASFTWDVSPGPSTQIDDELDYIEPEIENADIITKSQARVYPNPVHHEFTVEFILENEETLGVSIFDLAGREINLGEHFAPQGVSNVGFSIRNYNLSSGSYYLKVKSRQLSPFIYKILIK